MNFFDLLLLPKFFLFLYWFLWWVFYSAPLESVCELMKFHCINKTRPKLAIGKIKPEEKKGHVSVQRKWLTAALFPCLVFIVISMETARGFLRIEFDPGDVHKYLWKHLVHKLWVHHILLLVLLLWLLTAHNVTCARPSWYSCWGCSHVSFEVGSAETEGKVGWEEASPSGWSCGTEQLFGFLSA